MSSMVAGELETGVCREGGVWVMGIVAVSGVFVPEETEEGEGSVDTAARDARVGSVASAGARQAVVTKVRETARKRQMR